MESKIKLLEYKPNHYVIYNKLYDEKKLQEFEENIWEGIADWIKKNLRTGDRLVFFDEECIEIK